MLRTAVSSGGILSGAARVLCSATGAGATPSGSGLACSIGRLFTSSQAPTAAQITASTDAERSIAEKIAGGLPGAKSVRVEDTSGERSSAVSATPAWRGDRAASQSQWQGAHPHRCMPARRSRSQQSIGPRALATPTLDCAALAGRHVPPSGGCGTMYAIEVTAADFDGKTKIKQHQLVTKLLSDDVKQWHGARDASGAGT